jgi:hypothetical protein
VISGYLNYIKKRWGKVGLDDFLKEMETVVPNPLVEKEWYDADISETILGWMAINHGKEHLERCGNTTVKDLGILSYIVRFANIKSLLKLAPKHYCQAFDYGKMNIEVHEAEKFAIITMKDTAISEYSCPTWIGAFTGMLEMTKTKGTVSERMCQWKGAPNCEFEMQWE